MNSNFIVILILNLVLYVKNKHWLNAINSPEWIELSSGSLTLHAYYLGECFLNNSVFLADVNYVNQFQEFSKWSIIVV